MGNIQSAEEGGEGRGQLKDREKIQGKESEEHSVSPNLMRPSLNRAQGVC